MTAIAVGAGSATGAGTAATVTTAVTRLDAMRSRALYAVVLAEILTDTPIRAWDGLGTFTTPDARTWEGLQTLGTVSPVEAGERVESRGFSIGLHIQAAQVGETTFSELMTLLATTYNTEVSGKEIKIYIGVYDETGTLIEDTLTLWASGVGSHITRNVDRDNIRLTISADSRLAQAFPGRSLFLTDQDQQELSSGDEFLEWVSMIAANSRNVTWSPTF